MRSSGKVISKLDFQILPKDIEAIVDCCEGAIEKLLMVVRVKLEFQSNPQSVSAKQAQLTKLSQHKSQDKSGARRDDPSKKGGKENKFKQDAPGFKNEQNLEKQLFEKSQKITEMAAKIQLLEQKLRNYEELLAIKEDKIKILQKPGKR